jgi:hypothetical protein
VHVGCENVCVCVFLVRKVSVFLKVKKFVCDFD